MAPCQHNLFPVWCRSRKLDFSIVYYTSDNKQLPEQATNMPVKRRLVGSRVLSLPGLRHNITSVVICAMKCHSARLTSRSWADRTCRGAGLHSGNAGGSTFEELLFDKETCSFSNLKVLSEMKCVSAQTSFCLTNDCTAPRDTAGSNQ